MEKAKEYSKNGIIGGAGGLIGGEMLRLPIVAVTGYYLMVLSAITFIGLNVLRSRDRQLR